MRDILVTLIITGSLPVCFFRPWVGVLIWSWVGYMNPHLMTWGIAQEIPFAYLVGGVTIAGLAFTRDRQPLPRERETYLLLLLWGLFGISTMFALYPEDAWSQLEKVSKILLMSVVTLLVVNEPRKLRALLLVIALSIGFYGLKGGIWAILTGANYRVLGPPGGSFISTNTGIGLGLNMVLPILFFLAKEERRGWLRHLLRATFAFSIIAVLATYSRGAFLGVLAVLSLLFLKSWRRMVTVGVLIVMFLVALAFLPGQWFERMATITTYEQAGEQSALRRLDSWYVAYRIMLDHPLIGAGFRPFTVENYRRYAPERSWQAVGHDAHSIYFQVMAEHGVTGIVLYLGLILSMLLTLRRLIKKTNHDAQAGWINNYAHMVEASLAAYLVNGAFFSVSYFDLFYHVVVIVILLKIFYRRHVFEGGGGAVPEFAGWRSPLREFGLQPGRGGI